jgi:CRP-like cAMP-binding protein
VEIYQSIFVPQVWVWDCIRLKAVEQSYAAGTAIFQQGMDAKSVYFIENGIVKLTYVNQSGDELIIALCSSGSVLGTVAAALKKPFQVSGTAVTNCLIHCLSGSQFISLLQEDAAFLSRLHQSQSEKLYELVEHVAQNKFCDAQQRLKNLLWQLIHLLELDASKTDLRMILPLKQEEIASLIGVHATYVSKLLKELEREGVIARRKGWLIVPHPKALSYVDG